MAYLPSADTLSGAIRRHFGLSQADLARYLGVTPAHVAHFEARRRRAAWATYKRLDYLALLLPSPTGHGAVSPAFAAPNWPAGAPVLTTALPDIGPLGAGELQDRLLQVRAQASGLRLVLHQAGKVSRLQQRREWALTVLQAAQLPTNADAAERAHFIYWLEILAADVKASIPRPAARAKLTLAAVRALALEAEAAVLSQLLERAV